MWGRGEGGEREGRDEGESEGGEREGRELGRGGEREGGEREGDEGLITIFFLVPRSELRTQLPSGHFAILVWSCAELSRGTSSACVCVCVCVLCVCVVCVERERERERRERERERDVSIREDNISGRIP